MIKRLIALFSAAAISCAGISAFAADENVNPDFEERMKKAEALGIEFDRDIKSTDTISRAKFSKIILGFAGVESYEAQSDSFYDVDKDYPYFNEINISANLGYTVGYPDGNFKPDSLITVNDAVKVFVNTLGYELPATQNGGYPAGYLSTASSIGLLDGVKTGDGELTYDTLLKIIDNAYECKVFEISIKDGDVTYNESEDKDALWKFHRTIKAKAIVTATGVTGLEDESDKTSGNDYAKLNGEVVAVGDSDAAEYLGYAVEAYVYYDEDDDFGEVKYITPSSKNTTVVVDAKNVLSESADFTAYKFVYENEAGRVKNVKITSDTNIIYNGIAKAQYKKDDLIPEIGNVTLIDNDADGDFEVISIFKADKIIVLDYAAADDKGIKIYDQKDSSKIYFYDDEYKNYVIYINGERNTAQGLAKNMVVLIGTNGDHSITYAFEKTVTGKVSTISKKDDGTIDKIVIDGVEYDMAPGAEKYNIKMNDSGLFRIDDMLNVYAFEKEAGSDDFAYGYMIAGYFDEDESPMIAAIKVLTAENKFERFNLKETLRFNGAKKDADEVLDALRFNGKREREFEPQLLMYKLDENGDISELCSVTKDGKLTWAGRFYAMNPDKVPASEYTGKPIGSTGFIDKENKVYVVPSNHGYVYYANSWSNMWYQDDNTIFFNINDKDLESSYISQRQWAPQPTYNYAHELYNEDEDTHTIGAVIWKRAGSAELPQIAKNLRPAIVKSATTVLDADDLPVKALIVEQSGKTISIEWNENAADGVKEIFQKLHAGDIIYFELDGNGKLSNLDRVFDIEKADQFGVSSAKGEVHGKNGSAVHAEKRSQYVHITKKLSNYFFEYTGVDETSGRLQKMNTGANIYRMTVRGNKVKTETITWDDVQNGDNVFFYAATNMIWTMIVVDKR